MATVSQPSILLSFGGSCHHMDAVAPSQGRRSALRLLARAAEEKFGLVPGKYSFVGTQGKVDTLERLEDELHEAESGVCQLEICEREDGKMMREMQQTIKALEARLEQKIEGALDSMRKEVDSSVRLTANEMHSLTLRMDALSEEALAARVDALAGEEGLKERLDALTQDCLAMREDSLAGEDAISSRLDKVVQELEASCSRSAIAMLEAENDAEESLKQLEALERELQNECDVMMLRELNSSLEDDVDALRAEVRELTPALKLTAAPVEVCLAAAPVTAMAADLATGDDAIAPATAHADSSRTAAEPLPPWAPMSTLSIPYSTKISHAPGGVTLKQHPAFDSSKRSLAVDFGVGSAAPFAQCTLAPRLRACRSSPVLAPLR